MTTLATYNKKRDFKQTREPRGKKETKKGFRFVVQRHMASRLHYDFRLELGGVLKSWAVPKGPSLNPATKRLAVMVEDHPVDYIDFKGTIPEGNYGAGIVQIWDNGSFTPVDAKHEPIAEKQALENIRKGELKFSLKGKKLNGEFVLVRLKNDDKNWLLIKHKDEHAVNTIWDAEQELKKSKPTKTVAADRQSSSKKVTGSNKTVKGEGRKSTEDKTSEEQRKVGKFTVKLTNQQKNWWPDEGYTKGDVINYYDAVADFILPHLKNRPLSLKRNPNGIRDEGFYHKDAGENAPEFAEVFPVESESSNKVIDYLVCNNRATLLYLANLGCIEINPWNSTTKAPDNPTWMVIDIDPASKNTFTEVVDVALVTREILKKARLTGICKTSGASGLHVYVPMKNKYDYSTVKEFAHVIAALVQEQLPETTSLERSLKKRGEKIYVDFLQNRIGQTLACAYSLRPVAGANVSTPLDWKEVNHKLHPSQFNITNTVDRLKKKGDLFAEILTGSTNIEKALKALKV
jgi:DNA ligase D-like protein (predicted polymerase)/DNA ligase D-like protein (predicted 3'-phosphoesterase)